jgi:hypothetical protein
MSTSPITRVKDKYKIKNRKAYNKNLCRRGSLTLWLDESVLQEWEQPSGRKKEGSRRTDLFGQYDSMLFAVEN